jgi:hypothetical protein
MPVKPSSHPNFCELDHSTALISESISAGGSKFFSHHLSAHASPLQDGLYIVWLSADTYTSRGRPIIVIRKYHLSPLELSCHHKTSQLRFPSVSRLWFDRGDAAISYAGHMNVVRHLWGNLPDRRYAHGIFPLGDGIGIANIYRQMNGLKLFRKVRVIYIYIYSPQ